MSQRWQWIRPRTRITLRARMILRAHVLTAARSHGSVELEHNNPHAPHSISWSHGWPPPIPPSLSKDFLSCGDGSRHRGGCKSRRRASLQVFARHRIGRSPRRAPADSARIPAPPRRCFANTGVGSSRVLSSPRSWIAIRTAGNLRRVFDSRKLDPPRERTRIGGHASIYWTRT